MCKNILQIEALGIIKTFKRGVPRKLLDKKHVLDPRIKLFHRYKQQNSGYQRRKGVKYMVMEGN